MQCPCPCNCTYVVFAFCFLLFGLFFSNLVQIVGEWEIESDVNKRKATYAQHGPARKLSGGTGGTNLNNPSVDL